ncbi:hypothetical protein JOM56_000348 [Amanita muscaria]
MFFGHREKANKDRIIKISKSYIRMPRERRVQEARSDKEGARLEEDLKFETGKAREELLGPRVRRKPSDSVQSVTKEEHSHAIIVDPFIEPWTARHNGDEPEPPLYHSSSRSPASFSTNLDQLEDDRAGRSRNMTTKRYSRRGNISRKTQFYTKKHRKPGFYQYSPLTTEPIPKCPNVNEHEAVVRRLEGELTRLSVDKGKERSRTKWFSSGK